MEITVEGFAELDRALAALPVEVGQRTLAKAVRETLAPVRDRIEAAAPRRKGTLADSIVIAPVRERETSVEYQVGPSGPGWYGFLIEFGFRGFAPRPFVRPAWDSAEAGMIEELKRQLGAALGRAWRRYVKKASGGGGGGGDGRRRDSAGRFIK